MNIYYIQQLDCFEFFTNIKKSCYQRCFLCVYSSVQFLKVSVEHIFRDRSMEWNMKNIARFLFRKLKTISSPSSNGYILYWLSQNHILILLTLWQIGNLTSIKHFNFALVIFITFFQVITKVYFVNKGN